MKIKRLLSAPATSEGDSPTIADPGMQDIQSRIEQSLLAEDEARGKPQPKEKDEVVNVDEDDEFDLPPDDDDTGSDDDDDEVLDPDDGDPEELTLADYLGIDDDRIEVGEDGKVTITSIIDGEKKPVDLKDLVKSYQLQGNVNNRSIALENERKEFEGQKNTVAAAMQEQMNGLEAMSKALEQQIVADFQGIDWEKLRATNPAEWTALRQEFADRAQKIQTAQQAIHEARKKEDEKQQNAMLEQQQTHLQGEMVKMIQNNPTWADQAVMAEETGKIRNFVMTTYGFSEEDLQYVTDHRLISLIQDAQKYREGKQVAKKKQTAKPVPKMSKPGAAKHRSLNAAKARAVKAKRGQLRKSGKISDAAALLVDRM